MGDSQEDGPGDGAEGKMGLWGLFAVAFFWVSGGIYGNEPLANTGPPALIFGVQLAMPLLFGIPCAIITAELACALPTDGGMVVWVSRAFGKRLGAHNSWWVWASFIVDSAIYPVMAAQYLIRLRDVWPGGQVIWSGLFGSCIVSGVTAIKLGGSDVLVTFSTLLTCLSLAPTVVFLVWGLPHLEPATWVDHGDMPVQGGVMFSWILWLYSGFLSLGTLAGSIDDPKRTFPRLIAILVPFVILLNMMPFMISFSFEQPDCPVQYQPDGDAQRYYPGYFTTIVRQNMAGWLGWGFVAGSLLCLVGLYANTIIGAECAMQYFMQENFAHLVTLPPLASEAVAEIEYPKSEPLEKGPSKLWRWLFEEAPCGAAPVYILINGVLANLLVWLPETLLVEVTMLIMALATLVFLYAFVALRVWEPELERPFRVPGGPIAAMLLTMPPALCTLAQIVLTLMAPPTGAAATGSGSGSFSGGGASGGSAIGRWIGTVPHFKAWALCTVVGVGVLAEVLYTGCRCCGLCGAGRAHGGGEGAAARDGPLSNAKGDLPPAFPRGDDDEAAFGPSAPLLGEPESPHGKRWQERRVVLPPHRRLGAATWLRVLAWLALKITLTLAAACLWRGQAPEKTALWHAWRVELQWGTLVFSLVFSVLAWSWDLALGLLAALYATNEAGQPCTHFSFWGVTTTLLGMPLLRDAQRVRAEWAKAKSSAATQPIGNSLSDLASPPI